ncbi:rCG47934 [Rattus norvegicus]|uniref:RCG47934 n=1 Tax=Rattus norvegicus TaxID=10116 RepID=A6HZ84_RAT|nr:rCG47934 [Rattus norvegicus]
MHCLPAPRGAYLRGSFWNTWLHG